MQTKIDQLKGTIQNLKSKNEEKFISQSEKENQKGSYINLDIDQDKASEINSDREQYQPDFADKKNRNEKICDTNGFNYNNRCTTLAKIHQSKLNDIENKKCWGRFSNFLYRFISYFLLFESLLSFLNKKYNREVFTLFDIFRFMFFLSLGVFVTFAYFLVVNGIKNDFSSIDSIYCRYFIPCMLFYSNIPVSYGTIYSISYATMTCVVFYFSFMKYLSYSNLKNNSEIYENTKKKFSLLFFNSWDWSTNLANRCNENKNIIRENLRHANEELGRKKRTHPFVKFILRFFSLILSLSWLCIYAGFIFAAYILRIHLRDKELSKTTYNSRDYIIDLTPPLLIALFNIIFPKVFKLFPYLEKWEFQASLKFQKSIRYFIAKILGLAVIYFLNIYFILLGNPLTNILPFTDSTYMLFNPVCPGIYQTKTDNSFLLSGDYTGIPKQLYSRCPQDDAVVNLLFILLAEYFMVKFFEIVLFLIHFCISRSRRQGYSYKIHYAIEESAVDYFSYNIQLYAIVPFFPYIVALSPFLLYIEIIYQKFKLLKLRAKPVKAILDIYQGNTIYLLFAFTFVMIIVFNTIYFISSIPRSNDLTCYNSLTEWNVAFVGTQVCGPFASNVTISQSFMDSINTITFFSFLYYVFSSPEPLIILLCIVICMFLYKKSNKDVVQFYLSEKEKETEIYLNSLHEEIVRLREEAKKIN